MSDTLTSRVKELFDFSTERHAIYIRKSQGEPRPWTTDSILDHYHFCNIFRELDKTLVWIRSWLQAHQHHPNLWLAACLARRINYPPTLMEIGFPFEWEPERIKKILHDRMARGVKTFNPNAYRMVSGKTGGDLPRFVVDEILQPLWEARDKWPVGYMSLRELLEHLMTFPGWGPMISYQCIMDVVGTSILPDPVDRETWCYVGPGGVRGLNRLFGRPLELGLQNRRVVATSPWLDEIRWLKDQQNRYWPRSFPKLLMCDVENMLCENDKYIRIVEGGTGQRLYTPLDGFEIEKRVAR